MKRKRNVWITLSPLRNRGLGEETIGRKSLLYKPDRTFKKWQWRQRRKATVAVKVVPMPSFNRWEKLIVAQLVIVFEANFLIVPVSEGEINEESSHPLSKEILKNIPSVSDFSFSGNSGQVRILTDHKPMAVARKVSRLLIRWETDDLYRLREELRWGV